MRTQPDGAMAANTNACGGNAAVPGPGAGYPVCRVLPAADAVLQRWRNGGGITHQIAVWPPASHGNDFVWRISAADVSQPGSFSDWSGFDRQIWITRGAGVRLTDPATGIVTTLRRGMSLVFPGERRYACDLLRGPVRDLNIMLRRGLGRMQSALVRGSGAYALRPGHNILYCADGSARVLVAGKCIATLAAGDAVHMAPEAACEQQHASVAADNAATECIAIHVQADSPPASADNPGHIGQGHST